MQCINDNCSSERHETIHGITLQICKGCLQQPAIEQKETPRVA